MKVLQLILVIQCFFLSIIDFIQGETCQAPYFTDIYSELGNCVQCAQGCLNCQSTSIQSCEVCKPDYFRNLMGQCVKNCNQILNETCILCELDGCNKCGDKYTCLECNKDFILINGICRSNKCTKISEKDNQFPQKTQVSSTTLFYEQESQQCLEQCPLEYLEDIDRIICKKLQICAQFERKFERCFSVESGVTSIFSITVFKNLLIMLNQSSQISIYNRESLDYIGSFQINQKMNNPNQCFLMKSKGIFGCIFNIELYLFDIENYFEQTVINLNNTQFISQLLDFSDSTVLFSQGEQIISIEIRTQEKYLFQFAQTSKAIIYDRQNPLTILYQDSSSKNIYLQSQQKCNFPELVSIIFRIKERIHLFIGSKSVFLFREGECEEQVQLLNSSSLSNVQVFNEQYLVTTDCTIIVFSTSKCNLILYDVFTRQKIVHVQGVSGIFALLVKQSYIVLNSFETHLTVVPVSDPSNIKYFYYTDQIIFRIQYLEDLDLFGVSYLNGPLVIYDIISENNEIQLKPVATSPCVRRLTSQLYSLPFVQYRGRGLGSKYSILLNTLNPAVFDRNTFKQLYTIDAFQTYQAFVIPQMNLVIMPNYSKEIDGFNYETKEMLFRKIPICPFKTLQTFSKVVISYPQYVIFYCVGNQGNHLIYFNLSTFQIDDQPLEFTNNIIFVSFQKTTNTILLFSISDQKFFQRNTKVIGNQISVFSKAVVDFQIIQISNQQTIVYNLASSEPKTDFYLITCGQDCVSNLIFSDTGIDKVFFAKYTQQFIIIYNNNQIKFYSGTTIQLLKSYQFDAKIIYSFEYGGILLLQLQSRLAYLASSSYSTIINVLEFIVNSRGYSTYIISQGDTKSFYIDLASFQVVKVYNQDFQCYQFGEFEDDDTLYCQSFISYTYYLPDPLKFTKKLYPSALAQGDMFLLLVNSPFPLKMAVLTVLNNLIIFDQTLGVKQTYSLNGIQQNDKLVEAVMFEDSSLLVVADSQKYNLKYTQNYSTQQLVSYVYNWLYNMLILLFPKGYTQISILTTGEIKNTISDDPQLPDNFYPEVVFIQKYDAIFIKQYSCFYVLSSRTFALIISKNVDAEYYGVKGAQTFYYDQVNVLLISYDSISGIIGFIQLPKFTFISYSAININSNKSIFNHFFSSKLNCIIGCSKENLNCITIDPLAQKSSIIYRSQIIFHKIFAFDEQTQTIVLVSDSFEVEIVDISDITNPKVISLSISYILKPKYPNGLEKLQVWVDRPKQVVVLIINLDLLIIDLVKLTILYQYPWMPTNFLLTGIFPRDYKSNQLIIMTSSKIELIDYEYLALFQPLSSQLDNQSTHRSRFFKRGNDSYLMIKIFILSNLDIYDLDNDRILFTYFIEKNNETFDQDFILDFYSRGIVLKVDENVVILIEINDTTRRAFLKQKIVYPFQNNKQLFYISQHELIIVQKTDQSLSLYSIYQPFSSLLDINLTSFVSEPYINTLGEIIFFNYLQNNAIILYKNSQTNTFTSDILIIGSQSIKLLVRDQVIQDNFFILNQGNELIKFISTTKELITLSSSFQYIFSSLIAVKGNILLWILNETKIIVLDNKAKIINNLQIYSPTIYERTKVQINIQYDYFILSSFNFIYIYQLQSLTLINMVKDFNIYNIRQVIILDYQFIAVATLHSIEVIYFDKYKVSIVRTFKLNYVNIASASLVNLSLSNKQITIIGVDSEGIFKQQFDININDQYYQETGCFLGFHNSNQLKDKLKLVSQISGFIEQYEKPGFSKLKKSVYYVPDGQYLEVDDSLKSIKSSNIHFIFATQDKTQKNKIVYNQSQSLPEFLNIISLQNIHLTGQGSYNFNFKGTIKRLYFIDCYLTSNQSSILFENIDTVIIEKLKIFIDVSAARVLQQSDINQPLFVFKNCNNIIIKNVEIDNQIIYQPLIYVNGGTVSIDNLKITNSQLLFKTDSLIFLVNCEQETITNLTIDTISSQTTIISSQTSQQFTLQGGTIYKINGLNQQESGSLIVVQGTQNVLISDINIELLKQFCVFQIGSLDYDNKEIFNMEVTLRRLNITNNISSELHKSIISLYSKLSITIQGIKYENTETAYIQILMDSQTVKVTDSHFLNNHVTQGTLFIIQHTHSSPSILYLLQGNTFFKNQAFYGSVLSLDSISNIQINGNTINENATDNYEYGPIQISNCQQVYLKSNKIYKNKSLKGSGGGLLISSSQVTIDENEIYQNQAKIGGGIRYIGISTVFNINRDYSKLVFDNQAELYGQNIGSYPVKYKEVDGFDAFKNVPSGQKIEHKFQFYVLDEEGNQMKMYKFNRREDYHLQIIEEQTNFIQFDYIIDNPQFIISDKVSINENSIFEYEPTFTYIPEKNITFMIATSQNIMIYNNLLNKFEKKLIVFNLNVHFRECKQGEVLQKLRDSLVQCSPCIDNTYSLVDFKQQFGDNIDYLSLASSQSNPYCQKCSPSTFKCQQNLIYPKDGFWKSKDSPNIIPCFEAPHNCLFETYMKQNQDLIPKDILYDRLICREGMIGPLCQSCDYKGQVWDEPYGGVEPYNCVKCSRVQNESIYFVLIIICFILYLAFTVSSISNSVYMKRVWLSLRIMQFLPIGASAENDVPHTVNKLLMSHLSIIGIIGYYKFNIQLGFTYLNKVGDPSTSAFYSFECLAKNIDIPIYLYKSVIGIVFFSLCALVIEVLLYILFRFKFFVLQNSKLLNFVGLFFFFGPILLKVLASSLACYEIDGIKYIKSNLTEKCYTNEHLRGLYIIIPLLCFLSIFIPLFLYLNMRRKKLNIKSIICMKKYAYLCLDYKQEKYFWELIRYTERNFISLIAIYIEDVNNSKQVVISFILVAYLFLLIRNQPYNRPTLNSIELMCTNIQIYNCFALSVSQNISAPIQTILGVIYIIANYLIIVYLLKLLIVIRVPSQKDKQNKFHVLLLRLKSKAPAIFSFVQKKAITDLEVFCKWKIVQKKFLQIIHQNKKKNNKIEQFTRSPKKSKCFAQNKQQCNYKSPQFLLNNEQTNAFASSQDNNYFLDNQSDKFNNFIKKNSEQLPSNDEEQQESLIEFSDVFVEDLAQTEQSEEVKKNNDIGAIKQ